MPSTLTALAESPRELELVEAVLNLRIINVQPLAQLLYPLDPPKTASAKFHNKRQQIRYHKFSADELRRLLEILAEQLQPIAQAFPQLLACSTLPNSNPIS